MKTEITPDCSSTMIFLFIEGIKEVVGSELFQSKGLSTKTWDSTLSQEKLLETAPASLAPFMQTLTDCYGMLGARGISMRSGEACFRYFIRSLGVTYRLVGYQYRLMSSHKRIPFGFSQLAEFFKDHCGLQIEIREEIQHWSWEVDGSGFPEKAIDLWSALFKGFLREYLSWTTGGRQFVIRETPPDDLSNARIQMHIQKQPLGN